MIGIVAHANIRISESFFSPKDQRCVFLQFSDYYIFDFKWNRLANTYVSFYENDSRSIID